MVGLFNGCIVRHPYNSGYNYSPSSSYAQPYRRTNYHYNYQDRGYLDRQRNRAIQERREDRRDRRDNRNHYNNRNHDDDRRNSNRSHNYRNSDTARMNPSRSHNRGENRSSQNSRFEDR